MDCVAVICEYNPFHNGHALLIERARSLYPELPLVSVMSGNTVQRGDFAIFDRYTRAKAAIACGSDLVLELPYPYSCSSAEQFASAGVRIAAEFGASHLIFGVGAERVGDVADAARIMGADTFRSELAELARKNPDRSYISLREELYRSVSGRELAKDGNSSLGVEYILACERLKRETGQAPECEPFLRTAPFSATECRNLLLSESEKRHCATECCDILLGSDEKAALGVNCQKKQLDCSLRNAFDTLIPEKAREVFEKAQISGGISAISAYVLGALRAMHWTGRFLNGNESGGEKGDNGIRAALVNAAVKAADIDEFYALIPTSTYTRARLRRELLDALIIPDIEDCNLLKNTPPAYTVLLGASERGLKVLSDARKNGKMPVITKPSDSEKLSESAKRLYALAQRADSVYSLTFSPAVKPSALIPRFRVH